MAKSKKKLFRLPDGTIAYLELNSLKQIIKDKGLGPGGDVQQFHTANVLRRILKYMPMQSGMTAKVTVAQTDIRKPKIITNTPYARFLYEGKVMVSDVTGSSWARKGETKHVINKKLDYNKTKNALAGSRWDERLQAAEGGKLRADVQAYIKRKG